MHVIYYHYVYVFVPPPFFHYKMDLKCNFKCSCVFISHCKIQNPSNTDKISGIDVPIHVHVTCLIGGELDDVKPKRMLRVSSYPTNLMHVYVHIRI